MDLDEAPAGEVPENATLNAEPVIDPVLEEFKALKKRIYQQCWDEVTNGEENRQTVFYQTDLMDLGIVPDNHVETLLRIVQALQDEKLFKPVTSSEGLGWRVRSEEEAKT
jgi:DNA-directed RNA polymerase III subunit RPC6